MPHWLKGWMRSELGLFLIVSNITADAVSVRMDIERDLKEIGAFGSKTPRVYGQACRSTRHDFLCPPVMRPLRCGQTVALPAQGNSAALCLNSPAHTVNLPETSTAIKKNQLYQHNYQPL